MNGNLLIALENGPSAMGSLALASAVARARQLGLAGTIEAPRGLAGLRAGATAAELLAECRRRQIAGAVIIGDADAMSTAQDLAEAARVEGVDLALAGVPLAFRNDLPGTEFCPGYPSTARAVIGAVHGLHSTTPITIVAIEGGGTGWLAAAACRARHNLGDAPHRLCLPERAPDLARLLTELRLLHRTHGPVVVVASAGDADELADAVNRELGIGARVVTPDLDPGEALTPLDRRAIEFVASHAVERLWRGERGFMQGLRLDEGQPISIASTAMPLAETVGQHRPIPDSFLDAAGQPNGHFRSYLAPLLGGALPRHA